MSRMNHVRARKMGHEVKSATVMMQDYFFFFLV